MRLDFIDTSGAVLGSLTVPDDSSYVDAFCEPPHSGRTDSRCKFVVTTPGRLRGMRIYLDSDDNPRLIRTLSAMPDTPDTRQIHGILRVPSLDCTPGEPIPFAVSHVRRHSAGMS